METNYPRITLKPDRASSVERRHPWIFSGSIGRMEPSIEPGMIVQVCSHDGRTLALGFYEGASIAVKIFAFGDGFSHGDPVEHRITSAIALRRAMGLFSAPDTDSFRLVFGEGDEFPGLIVDLLGRVAVVELHGCGALVRRERIVEVLREQLNDRIDAVYVRTDQSMIDHSLIRKEDRIEGVAWGREGGDLAPEGIITESGIRYAVSISSGQKTGFFLDQRENRRRIRALAKGREVLDCFCYSGSFGIGALCGEARQVTFVDSSARAIELARRNVELNGVADRAQFEEGDGLHYLKSIDQRFDCIILDPPAFVKHRGAVTGGLKGYETINRLAVEQIRPGGIIATFSCSQLVGFGQFHETVVRAANRARRSVRILDAFRQPPCHPANLFHPEGEYLKGLLLEVQ